ncbi:hypothetical protein RIF29_38755 [Crotalaria pallida]|uniref:Uncharacterized protein n=1 Tax=Crotalaria pallida TaxID=3830 RepID=A0AAN9E1S1_CROPI
MASACVNNFLDCPPPSYAWLSPRVSFSNNNNDSSGSTSPDPNNHNPDPAEPADFEFRLEDPVTMLPADELFSDGKLVPLHLSNLKPSTSASPTHATATEPHTTAKSHRRHEISISDPYLFSPKAPRCSSRWKELLGLKKLYQSQSQSQSESSSNAATPNKTTSSSSSSSSSTANKSLKQFLHRRSSSNNNAYKTTTENAPLLSKEHSDSSESVSISSSRLSLSSSSSSHDHDNDLPRLSLDSEKPNPNPISIHRNPNPNQNHPRIRLVKPRPASFDIKEPQPQYPTSSCNRLGRSPIRKQVAESGAGGCRGVSVDSPRMNSSGKIVFQSLERSSSSPSSFNGGPRFKNRDRGMERSYSANVRVTPVLNVPVCSLKSGSVFGFGQLFSSPQKKEAGAGNGNGNGNGGSGSSSNKGNQYRNRCDRS